MKLHLPVSLHKAILACFAVVASITQGATVVVSEMSRVSEAAVDNTITIDYANPEATIPHANGALQFTPVTPENKGISLNLNNTGLGDGKTYELFTGVTRLVDAAGNTITLDSSNNAISNYFDTTQPGSGFWAGATLQLTDAGTLQLVLHNETVKEAITITSRQTYPSAYQYYAGIAFEDISNVYSSAYGGAISGDVTLTGNGSVTFSGNTVSASSYASYNYYSTAYGGAISGSTITLSNNGSVSFSGNTASSSNDYAYGGAIYGATITLSNNGSVSFSGNTVSASYARGGAISGEAITLSDNGSVVFEGNTASSIGGAIYGDSYSTITLSNNGIVTFSGNTASASYASGGAIYGHSYSTITLSDNGSVSFSGNTASASTDASGGAIYTQGDLSIRNNDSVELYKNAEVDDGTYRLRSICAGGSGNVISLSAAAGKSIKFYDSVSIGSGATVNLNQDYTYQAEDGSSVTIKQQGDIIFTGKYTEQHLNDLLEAAGAGRTARAQEILNSRTTVVNAMTNLYGGRLRVEDGAIYQGRGITAKKGSGATVRVQNATLSHSGYDLTFNAGTTLELTGANTITGNVQMLEGSALVFDLTQYQGTTIHSGSWSVADGALVSVALDSSGWTGEWGEVKTIALLKTDAEHSASQFASSISPLTGNWGCSGLQWVDRTLSIAFKNGATNAEWTNAAGDFRWNDESCNWTDSGFTFARVNGADVTFGKSAEGSILLDGQMEVGKMTVSADAVYALDFATGASLTVQKDLVLGAGSVLTVHGDMAAAGVNAQGTLVVDGELNVTNAVTASSIQAGSLLADSLNLTNTENRGSITGDATVAGEVVAAGHLNVGGSLTASSLQAASLESAGLTLTDSSTASQVTGAVQVSGQVQTATDLTVGGAMSAQQVSVAGALTAASLQTEALEAGSLTLTGSGAGNVVTGALNVEGAVQSSAALSMGGAMSAQQVSVGSALTAASLQASSLEAAGLTLTDSSTASQVTGAVQVSGQVQTAADLTVGGAMRAQQVRVDGALTAASLQTVALEAASLTLTDGVASNRIGSSVAMAGAVESAGSLTVEGTLTVAELTAGGALSAQQVRVDGALTAASLQTEALEAASLTLTDGAASNRIGSSVAMTGAVESAGSLTVEGTLMAASLQTASLEAAGLTLTDSSTASQVTGAVQVSGQVQIAADLTVGGAMSAQQVRVDGALTAASLQTDALEAGSLKLTDAAASSRIGSSVAMTGTVDAAGSLTVEGALTAASLQTGALEVGSLVLTAGNTDNTVTGNLTAESVSLVVGSTLAVGGVLTTDEVQMSGTALALTAGSFGASTMNFELDRAALESLGLGYKQAGTIAQVSSALASGFVATLNGGADEVFAGAYKYILSASGSSVQVTADYAFDGMQVWYRGVWVGKTDWSDFFVGGYDAVNGVEDLNLNGATVQGANLYIAYEEGVTSAVVTNGSLEFDYVDLGGGQFEIGTGASVITSELYGKGETLVLHDDAVLNATELTLGTLVLNDSAVTVKKAAINAITGTEGTLAIEAGGSVTVKSDVILTGLTNEGSLNLGKKDLTVNALVDVGGNVTAGEVSVQSRGSRMAEFNKLVADKVTVVNSLTAGRYTDDLSVGAGSAIGELVAETLEVREGTVTLGRTSGSTAMSLLALDLQEDATLVLNQQTTLEVTDMLTATENATVQLKQNAAVSYDGMNISNRKESAMSVNAYALSGETELELNGAHVAATGSEDKVIDYKLVNSTVENAGTGTLRVTHAENSLSGVVASSGNVEVYNVTSAMSLDELRIATGLSVSLLTGDAGTPIEPAHEADVTVVGLAVFEKGATLNANLTMAAGSELRMEGPLHMGSTLELVSGADSITLGGSMYDAVAGMQLGESMTLFTGVDALVLTFDGVSVTYQPGDIQVADRVLASTYFGNLPEPGANQQYFITFTTAEVGGGELAFFMAPEPTTTTLSLLALAALAARRRRK